MRDNGTINQVAVQRSDFRGLLDNGGAPVRAGLERKAATLLAQWRRYDIPALGCLLAALFRGREPAASSASRDTNGG